LWYYLTEGDYDVSGKDVLYFAPVNGIEENLRDIASATTTDLDMESIDVRGDITKLPFDDFTFNTIICSHVLEHIPNDLDAMSEI
jgi:ubiquinone/menaquinone biosynthesis C-methylase UbiE